MNFGARLVGDKAYDSAPALTEPEQQFRSATAFYAVIPRFLPRPTQYWVAARVVKSPASASWQLESCVSVPALRLRPGLRLSPSPQLPGFARSDYVLIPAAWCGLEGRQQSPCRRTEAEGSEAPRL